MCQGVFMYYFDMGIALLVRWLFKPHMNATYIHVYPSHQYCYNHPPSLGHLLG
jgi:hypothetical protein